MAWTDQCRFTFYSNAKVRYAQQGKKKLMALLRKLSKESGIPYKTLYHWWNEEESQKKSLKTQTPEESEITSEDDSQKDDVTRAHQDSEKPPRLTCINCAEKPVYLNHGKPYGPTSKLFGLCMSCVMRKRRYGTPNKEKIICPNCTYAFLPEEAKRTRK